VFEAKRILSTTAGRVDTANNDINALKDMGMIPKTVINHYLTDTDAWFIRTNVKNGMKYFERRGDSFDMDNDWDTENAKFKATARYSFGMTDWRGIYGSQARNECRRGPVSPLLYSFIGEIYDNGKL
jgi:hypothetical protein